jgi:ABC-type spermidine/putrescine transport system permease subunit II
LDAVVEPAVDSIQPARPRASWLKVVAFVYLALIFVYLYLPSGLVGLMSFNVDDLSSFPIDALTLDWWRALFRNETVLEAAKNSLVVAASRPS